MPGAAARLVRSAASALSLLVVLLWLAAVGLPSILALTLAGTAAGPARRLRWVSTWARLQSRVVLALLQAGGARYVRHGFVETDRPGLMVMNHQSLLDIPTAVVMSGPHVPAFVARERYARVPMIASGLAMAGCPVIDPRADREGAKAVLRRAAHLERTLLIYPEGHRSCDGALQPFRSAGLLAILEERRLPVVLVATDGFCGGRRLVDVLFNVHRIRGRTEVVGRFVPPADAAALPGFVDHLEAALASHLSRMSTS